MLVSSVHGSGGRQMNELIRTVIAPCFQNEILMRMEDSAVVKSGGRIAVTTDSFVVDPLFFPGGDIGRLSVCGTVNDLLMSGAVPKYLTCGFILQEGLPFETLKRVCESMARSAQEAGVQIVAGDTKVVEGNGGLYINTAGVGDVPDGREVSASACRDGDAVLVSGFLGEHHAAVMSARMGIENAIESDNAPLNEMTRAMWEAGVRIHAMRDVTRGGLATVLHEFAEASGCCVELREEDLPVSDAVHGFCGLLGLDPLYMGNEGKLAVVVPGEDASLALSCLRASRYGEHAACVGRITMREPARVLVHTLIGGIRIVPELVGEGLPRIC